jgi:uncharacterized protein YaeQ
MASASLRVSPGNTIVLPSTMAQTATPVRFKVQLSHVDRGVYEAVEVKMAQHPSETRRYLLCRLCAYLLLWEEGLTFSKGGLSSPDEAPLSSRTLDGRLTMQVEIGTPSAERLHKASKAAPRVIVVTHQPLAQLQDALAGQKVHKLETIDVFVLDPKFLDAVDERLAERGGDLDVTISDGLMYVNVGGVALETPVVPVRLA